MRASVVKIGRALQAITGRSPRLRLMLGALVALAVLSVPMFPAADNNWVTFHANAAREGNAVSYHLPPLNLSWTAPGSNPASGASPAIEDGVIYTVSGGLVRARNALTGAQIWQRDFVGSDLAGSAPSVIADGVIVVASTQQPDLSYRNILYKLNKTTGATIWSRDPAGFGTGYSRNVFPTVAVDKVIVVNSDVTVVEAVSTTDGSQLWSAPQTQRFISDGGAASSDKVFFPYTGVGTFGLMALNLSNGSEAWSRSMPSPGVFSVPLYLSTSNRLFVGTGSGNTSTPGSMFALDASNGTTIWQVNGFDQIYHSTPTPANNNLWIVFGVYSLTSNNAVVALRTSDGGLVWQTALPDRDACSLALANGYVYVTSWDGRLRTINVTNGAIEDNDVVGFPTDSISHPAVWGERVYVESAGTLYAFQGTSDPDDDNDGDPDTTDCAPLDPTIGHLAVEVCDGIDNNCVNGVDEGFPNFDGDSMADCVDPDDDNDGYNDDVDCDPLNATNFPGAPEEPSASDVSRCFDNKDNNCNGVVDLDCALEASTQLPVTGTVTGGLTDIRSTSTPNNVYERITEAGTSSHKRLDMIWTFPVIYPNVVFNLKFEGFKNSGANDTFTFSYTAASTCTDGLGYTTSPMTVTKNDSDGDTLQSTPVGSSGASTPPYCIKLADAANDSSPDTVSVDRLYLFPAPACVDADGDGYTPTCDGSCNNVHCPQVDCDDANYNRNPGQVEGPQLNAKCSDGYDNDCDGLIDGADPGCQPFETLAAADNCPGNACIGKILSGSYQDTFTSNDGYEVLQEAKVNGVSTMRRIWRFDNVPTNSAFHWLHVEAHRVANNDGDDFVFWETNDPTLSVFYGVPGLTINNTTDPPGGVDSQSFSEPYTTIYIMITDTAGGANNDTVHIDQLTIRTFNGGPQ